MAMTENQKRTSAARRALRIKAAERNKERHIEALRLLGYTVTPPIDRSAHQAAGPCEKCAGGEAPHCSWCGEDFITPEALSDHLDQGCLASIERAMGLGR